MPQKVILKPELREELKSEPRKEPPKALPPYKQNYSQLMWVGIVAIVLVGIIVIAQNYFKFGVPSPVPIISAEPSLAAVSSSPTPAPATPTPIVSEEPIKQIIQKEKSACGLATKSIRLLNDVFTENTCFTVGAEGITIDCAGFSIIGEVGTDTVGILSNYASTTIKNCFVSNFGVGIRLTRADSGAIEDSTLANNIGGIVLENSKGISVKRNRFFNNTEVSLLLTIVKGSQLEGNFLDNNRKFGVHLFGSENNTLRGNYIYRSAFGLQVAKSNDNIIDANNVSFNSAGVKVLEGSTRNVFSSNFISNNGGVGMHVLDSPGNYFRNNTIIRNEYGINIRWSKGPLENNYVCDNSIEDFECNEAQSAIGNTCFLRAVTCEFDCVAKCPSAK